jgi:hypothetical protein
MGPDLLLLELAEFGGDLEDDDDEALFESFSDFFFELLYSMFAFPSKSSIKGNASSNEHISTLS